jgi:Flp pilus assembly pilin Flp
MNRADEPQGGAATPEGSTERFGVSTLGFALTPKRSTQAPKYSSFEVGVSSSAQLRRPRTRREVKKVQKLFASLQKREEGQTMAEYGVVLAVITALVFGALSLLSGNIISAITRVAGYIS